MRKPSWERIELLKQVHLLSKSNEFGVARIMDIVNKLNKRRMTVAKGLTSAKQAGLVENPIRGGWRLSKKGVEVLEDFKPLGTDRNADR